MVILICKEAHNIKNVTNFVADKIRKYREDRNITQQELAEALGTTQQTIARYESGERKADHNVLFALAEYFKIHIDDFFPERNINFEKFNDYYDEVELLFNKAKPYLSTDDKETVKFIMKKAIKNYEENKNGKE